VSEPDRAKMLADRERQRKALQLWARKLTIPAIAREMGVSGWMAKKLVDRGLDHLDVPEAKVRRAQENEALDELERIGWGVVARPGYHVAASGRIAMDPESGRPLVDMSARLAGIQAVLRIMERRAKLNGLDAPTQVDVSLTYEAALQAVILLEERATTAEREAIDIHETRSLPLSESQAS
jgi:hypothetical protein